MKYLRNSTKIAVLALGLLLPHSALATETIRFASVEDLKILDPIFTTSATTIAHGYLVYDTLFAMDSNFKPQPQMVGDWSVSDDGLTYTFILRPGLTWHDGSPVEANDIIASLKRWGKISGEASAMMKRVAKIEAKAPDTIVMTFAEPFGPVLLTLANPVIPGFMMREEEASVAEDEQVRTIIGSGPFRFKEGEWKPGAKVVYERFDAYVPRPEPADGYAGGKMVNVDRVEWNIIPDRSTAVQALAAGEVDAMESVPADLLPLLKASGEVTVKVTNPLGVMGHLRINTLSAPFDSPKGRQALLHLINQDAFNTAAVGNVPDLKKTCYAIFGCGSAFETDAGSAPFQKVDVAAAQAEMKAAGYDGRPIVILDPTDWGEGHDYALIIAQSLKEAGFKVDLQAMDWSTLAERRSSKAGPSDPSHWDIFPTNWPTITMSNPISNIPLVSGCSGDDATWYGWPCDAKIEALRADFIKAGTEEEQKRITTALQERYYEYVPYINTGQYLTFNAWRNELKGVIPFMQMVFWNIDKP